MKCYFLYDFARDAGDDLRKICFIVNPGKDSEVVKGWDAKDRAIQQTYHMSVEKLIRKEFPELDE